MEKSDLPEFLALMAGVSQLHGKSLSEAVMEIYWQALLEFDFPSVKAAISAHVTNPDAGQFLPKPADIVRYLKGSGQTQALQAWSLVERSIRQIGSYDTVVFDDPLIHVVIFDMGGWISLCKIKVEELPFKAQEFAKRYEGFVLHPPKTHPKKLVGILEQQNSGLGYPNPSPILIGNRQKALEVYQAGNQPQLAAEPLEFLLQSSDKEES